jgi:beta-lactamase superfamily II metal-dependent hydrolase
MDTRLFKSEPIPELTSETYYAYLDSIEQIQKLYYLRFDCILTDTIDGNVNIKEIISELPSRVIEVSGSFEDLIYIIGYGNLYLLESSWMLLTTSFMESRIKATQFFNFTLLGDVKSDNYTIENVTLPSQMTSVQKEKVKTLVDSFKLVDVPTASEKEIKEYLSILSEEKVSHVNVYNVGQGNCNAIVDKQNEPLIYFDLGGGCNQNSTTNPNMNLSIANNPKVILSHWDQDHIQSAILDSRLRDLKWLAPNQFLSNTAYRLANNIASKGNLLYWDNMLDHVVFGGQVILKCTGKLINKNNSGLAMCVSYFGNGKVLLPGDADFKKIPNIFHRELIGVVASHHGSRGAIKGMPRANKPFMLAYSFGVNNIYQHAHASARHAYINQQWTNFKDTPGGDIAMIQKKLPNYQTY